MLYLFEALREIKQHMIQLRDDNIALREFRDSDSFKLATLCNNNKIHDNLRDLIPFPYLEQDAKYFINLCRNENPKTNLAIEFNGEFAGVIGLGLQTDVYKLSAEIGYWLGEPFWGKGIATRAVRLMLDYGFSTLGVVRIYSSVFDYNKPSQRVLEKAGFELEGIFRKAVFKNAKIYDEYRYAKLKPE